MAITPANWSSQEIDTIEVEFDKLYVLPTPPDYNDSPDRWNVYYRIVANDVPTTVEIEAGAGDQVFVTEVQHPTLGHQYAIHIRTISESAITETVEYVTAPSGLDSSTLEFRLKNLYGQLGTVPVLQYLSVTASTLTVSWTYSQHNANNIYYVEYSANETNWFSATQNGTQTNPYAVSGLAEGTLYYIRVRAFDMSLQTFSGYSNVVSGTTSTGGGKG